MSVKFDFSPLTKGLQSANNKYQLSLSCCGDKFFLTLVQKRGDTKL